MNLPQSFINEMKELLGEDFYAFENIYNEERTYGLRVNRLKINVEDFLSIFPYELEPIPWCEDGFYYDGKNDVVKHPYYNAGLFYIQEPTAMASVELLDINRHSSVLDFCSAPGGKTAQIASHLENTGIIIANDINFNRLKAVIRNIEKYGIKNTVVVNNTEDVISDVLEGKIDKILIDAPCSGEGMFRKDEKMISSYLKDDLSRYISIQKSLLENGCKIIKNGGDIVYSTCTFNKRENENQIEEVLMSNEEVKLVEMKRLMPNEIKGEGHFVSKITNNNNETIEKISKPITSPPDEYLNFEKEYLKIKLKGYFRIYKDKLYLSPIIESELVGLNVIRNGWYLGDIKKNRFEPSQSFALGLKSEEVENVISFKADDPRINKYLKGETIYCEGNDGYNIVAVDGYPLGWGKLSRGVLKNKYPPAWRIMK